MFELIQFLLDGLGISDVPGLLNLVVELAGRSFLLDLLQLGLAWLEFTVQGVQQGRESGDACFVIQKQHPSRSAQSWYPAHLPKSAAVLCLAGRPRVALSQNGRN